MWDLVGNPEDRFSHNEAQLIMDLDYRNQIINACFIIRHSLSMVVKG